MLVGVEFGIELPKECQREFGRLRMRKSTALAANVSGAD